MLPHPRVYDNLKLPVIPGRPNASLDGLGPAGAAFRLGENLVVGIGMLYGHVYTALLPVDH